MVCRREITREDVGGREQGDTREVDVINVQDVIRCLKKEEKKGGRRGRGPRMSTLSDLTFRLPPLPDQSPC